MIPRPTSSTRTYTLFPYTTLLRSQQFVRVFNGFRPIFTTAEHRNVVHRSRTVEGDQRDNIAKVCWLYLGQCLAHSFGFQLEHAARVTPFQKVVYRPIVPFEQIEIDIDATFLDRKRTSLNSHH